jgi:hypothetical protein
VNEEVGWNLQRSDSIFVSQKKNGCWKHAYNKQEFQKAVKRIFFIKGVKMDSSLFFHLSNGVLMEPTSEQLDHSKYS